MPEGIEPAAQPVSHQVNATVASARFAKIGEFVSRNIAGETILVPIRGRAGDLDSIYNLSEVGSFIWERIDGQASIQTIVESLCEEFDVAPQVAQDDAMEFIGCLQGAGLIEPLSEPPRSEY